MAATISAEALTGFIGGEGRTRHWTGRVIYTDGVRYLEEHGCAWLIDAVASYQMERKVRGVAFQIWTLTLTPEGGAVLTMQEDTNSPVLVKQDIPFTDCPIPLKLYLIDGVLLLPSEY